MLPVIRWILLFSAVTNGLLVTMLYRPVGAPLLNAWASRFADPARRAPAWLLGPRNLRAWALLSALSSLGLWWFLGTPTGSAVLEKLLRQAGGAA